jgi:hypothetical protein
VSGTLVHRLDLPVVALLDGLALDLHRRRQQAGIDGELVGQDGDLLRHLVAGEAVEPAERLALEVLLHARVGGQALRIGDVDACCCAHGRRFSKSGTTSSVGKLALVADHHGLRDELATSRPGSRSAAARCSCRPR